MNDFIKKCKQRIEIDLIEFGIKSVFLPNPVICIKPSFCLIGMEPSVNVGGFEKVKENINRGYKNFLHSEQDFILHYCAYKFLCNGSYNYYITDLSKGAMLTKDAKINRIERYMKWLPLLQDELKLLGNPLTIAIGDTLVKILNKLNFNTDFHITHYSWSNSKNIQSRYLKIENKSQAADFDNYENILYDFSCTLLKHVGYDESMIMKHKEKIFIRPLSKWKKALLALYRYEFLKFRNSLIA